jgi:hypothetical protein
MEAGIALGFRRLFWIAAKSADQVPEDDRAVAKRMPETP